MRAALMSTEMADSAYVKDMTIHANSQPEGPDSPKP